MNEEPSMAEYNRGRLGPHIWQIRAIRDCVWIAIGLAFIYIVYLLWQVFLPVFIALLFAYLTNPLQHWTAQRWGWSRSLTAIVILIISGLLFFGSISGFAPLVSDQVQMLQEKLPTYLNTLAERNGIELEEVYAKMSQWTNMLEDPQALVNQIVEQASRTFSILTRILTEAASWALLLVLIPIYFYFFSRGFDEGVKYVSEYLPIRHRDEILRVVGLMDQSTASFFRGRLVVAFIMIALFAVGWWWAGVPYWFLLSIFAGLLSIVPYASGIFWPLAVLLKYVDLATSGGSVSVMSVLVWPSVVFLVVQFLEGWLITPWIQSGQLNMSVPTILIVVFIGGALGGILGLLLAIPVAACIKILFQEVILPRLKTWALTH